MRIECPRRGWLPMLVMIALAIWIAEPARASQPWTNTAQHPSHAVDRGIKTTLLLLDAIGVAPCAQLEVAARMRLHRGEPLMVGNKLLWSKGWRFEPRMLMTFARDGTDYLQDVHPAVDAPFVASLFEWQCDGVAGFVALMPACQNLAALYPIDRQRFAQGANGDLAITRNHAVALPSYAWLIAIGALAWAMKTV